MDSHDKQALSRPKQQRRDILPRDFALGFAAVEEVEVMVEVLVIGLAVMVELIARLGFRRDFPV